MSRKTQRQFLKVLCYVAVVLIGALIVGGIFILTGNGKNDPGKQNESRTENASGGSQEAAEPGKTDGQESKADSFTADAEVPTVPEEDGISVNELIDRYYTAKITGDSEALNEIVDAETTYNETEIRKETQYIVKYDDFTSYTMPGPTEEYYVVYVRYNMYFSGIETGAPALNRFVVMKGEDGNFYIVDKELSGEFQEFLKEQENTDTVKKLRTEVNLDLQAACDKDPDLAYLMNVLNGNTPTESAPESTSESTSESVSESTEEESADSSLEEAK